MSENKYPRKFRRWVKSDNVVKIEEDLYLEQTTQYNKKFTLEELYKFYQKEYGTNS